MSMVKQDKETVWGRVIRRAGQPSSGAAGGARSAGPGARLAGRSTKACVVVVPHLPLRVKEDMQDQGEPPFGGLAAANGQKLAGFRAKPQRCPPANQETIPAEVCLCLNSQEAKGQGVP